jgi:endonuclease/exonuclease/phosphatase family metal-dependent hydrolase
MNTDTVRIFNMHLQSMHFAKADYLFIENINDQGINEMKRAGFKIMRKMKIAYLLRAAQATEIKAEILKSPYPVIVCGDMNDVPNSYSYQTIGNNLQDAFAEKGRGVGRTFKFLSPTLRIDYIFHSKELELNQVQVIRPSLSDHHPVVADFQLQ